jgi:hypothetical protein
MSRALADLELGKVNVEVLKNRRGYVDLLADLIRETVSGNESDAVVFVGPKPWYFDRIERSSLPSRAAGNPPFFYVQLRPFVYGATFPDTIMNAVKHVGGKTFEVYTPSDFAAAIRDITRALEEKQRAELLP